jgi:NAD(P)-dependent dehydrogenase (short-subunit alcohol dehydrogenase family)
MEHGSKLARGTVLLPSPPCQPTKDELRVKPFAGRSAVVTGAGGDIGRATVLMLLRAGARVLAVDADGDLLAGTVAAVTSTADGAVCESHVADVRDSGAVQGYAARAEQLWGPIDLFVNNAGIKGPTALLVDYPDVAFDDVIAVNVRGAFLGLKHVLPRMPNGGAVVNTASVAGHVGSPRLSAYIASKHALLGLTRTAALEVAGRAIRVNAVCPGPIDGRMMGSTDPGTTGRAGEVDQVPLGRSGSPNEVATLIVFLLSDGAGYATGGCYPIDGGITAG